MKHALIALVALVTLSNFAQAKDETELQFFCRKQYLAAWSEVAEKVMDKALESQQGDAAYKTYQEIAYNSNEAKLLNNAVLEFCKSLGQLK